MGDQVLCYMDDRGESRFVVLNPNAVDDWIQHHPACMVLYQFPVHADRIQMDKEMELEYKMNCARFGLSKSDLHCVFLQSVPRARFELVGMRTKNTKYKIIVRNVDTGQYIRMTMTYFKTLARDVSIATPKD